MLGPRDLAAPDDQLPPELRVLQALRARYAPPAYSEATWETYLRGLRSWAAWCEANGVPLLGAQRRHVEAFMASTGHSAANPRGLKPATLRRQLAAIQQFYLEAQDMGLVGNVPTLRVRRPSVEEDQRLGISLDQARLALRVAFERGPMEELLLRLLLFNGLRAHEVAGLAVGSCDREGGFRVLRYVAKGNKKRRSPLAAETAEVLDRLLVHMRGATGVRDLPADTALFTTGTGKQMTRFDVRRLTRSIGRAAGIRGLNPHAHRHAFVTLSRVAGVELRDVQESAGHADPKTTAGYDTSRHRLEAHATHRLTKFVSQDPDAG
ncbi:MAG TPA: tyrosine-type recombinase/integrase [Myxococcaceae bacterium]|nr:tyrosine-type recombinase/integrase [Myxococcaceae bacterium]